MEEITKKLIGQRINEALAQKGVKQKDLAKVLGVSDNTISYFCSGARVPNTEQLISISKALEVSTDYLLGLTPNTTTDPDLKSICDYTGLNENSIEALQEVKHFVGIINPDNCTDYFNFLNYFISNSLTSDIADFVQSIVDYKRCAYSHFEALKKRISLKTLSDFFAEDPTLTEKEKDIKYARYEMQDLFNRFIETYCDNISFKTKLMDEEILSKMKLAFDEHQKSREQARKELSNADNN